MSRAPWLSLPFPGIRYLSSERTICNGLKNSWKVFSVMEFLVVLTLKNHISQSHLWKHQGVSAQSLGLDRQSVKTGKTGEFID